MKPLIKFKLNINLDKQTCFNFLNCKYAGVDFGKGIIALYPPLKYIKKIRSAVKRKAAISQYVNQFYKSHKEELKNVLVYFQKEWKKSEQSFLKQADVIFNHLPWPKGKYICYPSMFNCNPRFLNNKTFQVYYKNKKEIKRIIAHELLHFIFYHYLNTKIKNKISINNQWIISEVFNVVILNQKEIKRIIAPAKELGYPEHKEYIRLLTNEWRKSKDISLWLKRAIKIVL